MSPTHAHTAPPLGASVFASETALGSWSSSPAGSDSCCLCVCIVLAPHVPPHPEVLMVTVGADGGGWAQSGLGVLGTSLPRPHSGAPRRKSLLFISSSGLKLGSLELARTTHWPKNSYNTHQALPGGPRGRCLPAGGRRADPPFHRPWGPWQGGVELVLHLLSLPG